jgi:hypothetical protein
LVLCSSPAAFAQPAGAQAETLFRQGRDLLRAGKTAEACSAFDESQKLEPAVTTLLNLADCREKLGQLATAWGLFLDAERQTRSATKPAEKQLHDVAQKHATNLEPRVSKLEIDVPDASKADGLEIKRGDQAIGAAMWNHALPIDGGTYTITASAPGSQAWSTQLTIANEQETKKIEVPKLVAAPVQHEPVTPTTPVAVKSDVQAQPASPSRTVPIVIGVGAVALLGGAVAFDLMGDSTYNDAKAEMTSQSRRDSLYDSANTKRYVAIGLGVGGIAAGGVAVWMFLHARHEDRSSEQAIHVVPTHNGFAVVGGF